MSTPMRRRVAALVVVSLACTGAAAGYLVHVAQRSAAGTRAVAVRAGAPSLAGLRHQPHVLFRSMVPGAVTQGRVGAVPVEAPGGPPAITNLKCWRVYVAGGRGVCVDDNPGFLVSFGVAFFGPDLKVQHQSALDGSPSRARVSPDGRLAAVTMFREGDSYAVVGAFSTATTFYDTLSGARLANLEDFTVTRDGVRFQAIDFNFWGVTFARERGKFYATLGTGGQTYLVEGTVQSRQVHVLRRGVECPSLSPDNTRIAFKRLVSKGVGGLGPLHWRVSVLDLETLKDKFVADTRNVDDQVEWLDDKTLLYAVDDGTGPLDTWAVPADGTGKPRLFIPAGDSPTVVRD